MTDEKVRENRLRRMADRQGLVLRKSARRDPRALDYGTYTLVPGEQLMRMFGAKRLEGVEGVSLDEIEAYLTRVEVDDA